MSDQAPTPTDRPTTVLEAAMLALSEETIEAETLLWVMTASDLLLPEVGEGEDSAALVIEEDDGVDYLALFTHLDQVPDLGEHDPEFSEVTGLDALIALPDDTGVTVNPGADGSFSVDPRNIGEFRRHLIDSGLIRES
ncbi:SseB family protein [Nocardioides sp.]|uniref:SseB family protein n=1 Tax=Nocardioides sp. TaxID=35761 RepID=UPI0027361F17|nr:SseB family protein [Nocardioides sp.]MDP3894906.1 SseB family protein [Nocardioides sp.]